MTKTKTKTSELREIAYRLDPALWVREVLQVTPTTWQETFLQAPLAASILALTSRQFGKTTTAVWAIAHAMLFTPGSLSVIACPAQRQSGEAVRRVRAILVGVGAELRIDHTYGLELVNGSRVLALPGSDDSIRGLTVDGWIVADEAARLTEDLIAALRPMRARCPQARLAMLSTAWTRTDPFWTAWSSEDNSWIRIKATPETDPSVLPAAFLEQELRARGEAEFAREYLGIPVGGQLSPFTWDLYDRMTGAASPSVPGGSAFRPAVPGVDLDRPESWPFCRPWIIAHDVGRSCDRSTAVVGGLCPYGPKLIGISELQELSQGLFGSARASELAVVDRRYQNNTLIVADLSNDATYAEVLYTTFGRRVIGVHITRAGDGMSSEYRHAGRGVIPVYTIGRSYLIDLMLNDLQVDQLRMTHGPMSQRAYQQLAELELEYQDSGGRIYKCPPGQHDDLGISCAMLVWAARHPHLRYWFSAAEAERRPPRPRPDAKSMWRAHTCG
jgi:hypothetical protein